jgi:glyoxylase-like metal-dependent hydrolase (beta-lactamase superfamily II)
MNKQISLKDTAVAAPHGQWKHSDEVIDDVACKRVSIVNVALIGRPGAADWVLIDAGIGGSAKAIAQAAAERFGEQSRPAAIVLTHAHFDHVGALETLADEWDVPIYAHVSERPFLDGSQAYPKPDPSVGGGLMARLSPLFPRGPINVARRLQLLPMSGDIPVLPGWRWIHTPGHTPGHVSLWREADRTLIAGDAFITTRQESAYAAVTQEPEMHGPPRYFTPDWENARESVRRLAALQPEVVVTGHGRPMQGAEMRTALEQLARDFDRVARPNKST